MAVRLCISHGESAYPEPVKATQPRGLNDALVHGMPPHIAAGLRCEAGPADALPVRDERVELMHELREIDGLDDVGIRVQ